MEFKLFHDISKKTLSVPRAALQLSELADAEELMLYTEPGCVLLARDDLTVSESLAVLRLLSDLTSSLLSQLKQASCEAAEVIGDGEYGEYDCECCSGFFIPIDLMELAGITPNEALSIAIENGRSVITAEKEYQDDPLDVLEADFLIMLVESGIDLDGLRYLLQDK